MTRVKRIARIGTSLLPACSLDSHKEDVMGRAAALVIAVLLALGLAAPAGTPPAIVERLNRDVRRVLADPSVQKRFAELGGESAPTSPNEMRMQVSSEIERWKNIVQTRHIEQQ